jgi:hypothetical protein
MFRKVLLFAGLIASASVFAQNQPNSGAQPQQAPATVNVVTPPGPNIYVVSGGLYGTGLYPLPYLPMAPSQNAAPPQAGTAGISYNSPTTYSGPGYSYSTPLYYSNPASPYYNATPVYPGAETTVAESGRQIVDMGPSYYVSASTAAAAAAAAPPPSVAEIAAQYRAPRPHNARMYTNADAEGRPGSLEISGILVIGNMPSPPAQSPPAQAEKPQTSTPNAGQISPPAGTEQTAPPAAQPSGAQQAAPPPSHAEESGNPSVLPASSTLLPLLGTLGLVSAAVGLWIARVRR